MMEKTNYGIKTTPVGFREKVFPQLQETSTWKLLLLNLTEVFCLFNNKD